MDGERTLSKEARTRPGGRIVWVKDTTANDSDKTVLTVPAGKFVQFLSLYAVFGTTGSIQAGNRRPRIMFTDGVDTIAMVTSANTFALAGARYELWGDVAYNYSAGINEEALPTPQLFLQAGYTIRVLDAAAIDPAVDDMSTFLCYIEYDA